MGKYISDDMLQFVAFKLKSQGQVTIYAPEEVPIAHTKQRDTSYDRRFPPL